MAVIVETAVRADWLVLLPDAAHFAADINADIDVDVDQ